MHIESIELYIFESKDSVLLWLLSMKEEQMVLEEAKFCDLLCQWWLLNPYGPSQAWICWSEKYYAQLASKKCDASKKWVEEVSLLGMSSCCAVRLQMKGTESRSHLKSQHKGCYRLLLQGDFCLSVRSSSRGTGCCLWSFHLLQHRSYCSKWHGREVQKFRTIVVWLWCFKEKNVLE